MSLIERMIQRTCAPHPSGIQPLLLPHFATSMLAREAADTFLESNRANPLGSSAKPLAIPSHTRAAIGDEPQPRSSSALPAPPFQQETTTVALEDRRLSGDSIRLGDSSASITQKRKAADNVASQHVEGIADAGQPAEGSPHGSAEPIHSSITGVGADRLQASSQQNAPQFSLSNSVRRRGPSEDDAAEKRTAPDVSITIGHIEVHAAQPAERIPRPAFRPRVSLDDFLGQHSGKQS